MGLISLLKGAFTELLRDPKLFIPKFISVTIFIPPYLALAQITAELARNPASAAGLVGQANTLTLIVLLMAPIWIFIDSMYPVLVQQRAEKGKLEFVAAAKHVLVRFLKIFLAFFAILVLFFVVNIPFTLLISLGMVTQMLPVVAVGIIGAVAVMFAGGILLYFVPTTIILERTGIVNAFKAGFSLSRQNFSLVFWLTLFSFAVLFLGFYAEGAFQGLGTIGFIIGRYVGGIVTVYLYVVNPSAYLELKEEGKPAPAEKRAKKRRK